MHSDEELVWAARSGDRAAFEMLVERYERSVRSIAIAVLHDVESAQNVAQEAFLTAFEKLSSLRNPSAFGPWVLRIAKRSSYQAARSKQRYQPLLNGSDPAGYSHNAKLDDRLERLLHAVVRLPQQERVVVMLRYFDDQSIDVIAKHTGRSVGTVTKQLARARIRLKSWLGDDS